VPLLAACDASYPFTISLLKRSIVTEKVAWHGYLILCALRVDWCSRTSGARRSSIQRTVGCSVWSTEKGLLGVRAPPPRGSDATPGQVFSCREELE
jgi:hypothetical protein